jgi:xanthine dehydrogenase accessory factor
VSDILDAALRLRRAGEPFVVATVTRAEKPTSAKPGAKAIITASGEWIGWIGGSCSRPSVEYEARRALASGNPHLVQLSSTETCASGGSLDIFLEPYVPKPHLIIIGHLPVARALVALASPLGFRVTVMSPEATAEHFGSADAFTDRIDLTNTGPGARYVVVASHGSYDQEAIDAAVGADADYVALVASKKRASALGIPESVKCPAGLDIGAVTPEEIALSILAEIVSIRRARVAEPEPADASMAKDPICGMMVAIDGARHRLTRGEETYYFCGSGCKDAYELKHAD